jgi:hypothetical protein
MSQACRSARPSSRRGELPQLGHVALGERPRAARQVAQEVEHLLRRLGHLRHQRHSAKSAIAEQLRLLAAQRAAARR